MLGRDAQKLFLFRQKKPMSDNVGCSSVFDGCDWNRFALPGGGEVCFLWGVFVVQLWLFCTTS